MADAVRSALRENGLELAAHYDQDRHGADLLAAFTAIAGDAKAPRAAMRLVGRGDTQASTTTAAAGDELADVLMSRYEKHATLITSNRPVEDWAKLLGDVVLVTPLLDRLMHHAHLLRFEGKSWRLKEAAARVASRQESV